MKRLGSLTLLLAAAASGQWLNFPTAGIPRTADGKPNLTAPAPKAANGKPVLGGIWHHFHRREHPMAQTSATQSRTTCPLVRQFRCSPGPPSLCGNGATMLWARGDPRSAACRTASWERCCRISVQDRGDSRTTLILREQLTQFRQIFTDGRGLPADMQPRVVRVLHRALGRRDVRDRSRPVSTTRRGSMTAGIRTPRRCARRNGSGALTSGT